MHPTPTARAFYRDLLQQVRLLGLRPDRGDLWQFLAARGHRLEVRPPGRLFVAPTGAKRSPPKAPARPPH